MRSSTNAKGIFENLAQTMITVDTNPGSDMALLAGISKGETEAMQALYQRYGKRMYAYALRLVGDSHTAEDVLQDSLLAVWQKAHTFRRKGRVIAWLLAIVHNKAMRSFRQKPTINLAVVEEQLADPGEHPSAKAHQRERNNLLRAGLGQLSIEQRTVLELVFYQGLTMQETAQVIDCPVGTVKSRLNAAKENMRGILNRQGLTAEDIV